MGGYKQNVWVLAIIGRNNDYKSAPIHLYYAERKNLDRVPPPNNWKVCGGIEPTPRAELIQMAIPKKKVISSPLQKAMEESNKDKDKMSEIMFDLQGNNKNNHSSTKVIDKGSTKVKQLIVNPRRSINQPGMKSKDIRRVRGE